MTEGLTTEQEAAAYQQRDADKKAKLKRYLHAYSKARSEAANNWCKEHPEWFKNAMKNLLGE